MSEDSIDNSLTYNFVESPQYREIYVDGVWGGIHPGGYIQMAMFKEKSYLPSAIEYNVLEEGRLEERERILADSITRELEADVRLTLNTAIMMRNWLDQRIVELTNSQQR